MSAPEARIADEVHRANHIAGVVFEGSVALAAAAAITAFQLEDKAVWVAAVIAALAALPGYIAAWTLLWNPLTEGTTELQRAMVKKQTTVVHWALIGLLTAVPIVAGLVVAAVLFPHEAARVASTGAAFVVAIAIWGFIHSYGHSDDD